MILAYVRRLDGTEPEVIAHGRVVPQCKTCAGKGELPEGDGFHYRLCPTCTGVEA